MATHFRISYGKWRQPCHIGAAQSRLTNPARVARRQDCDSHQKLVLIRSGALRLEILFEVSYPAPALFNGGRVDGSFRRRPAAIRAINECEELPLAGHSPAPQGSAQEGGSRPSAFPPLSRLLDSNRQSAVFGRQAPAARYRISKPPGIECDSRVIIRSNDESLFLREFFSPSVT